MKLGFYLHTSWEFAYPFAVRSWEREDFARMSELLQRLGFDTLMMWPLSETMPPPLSDDDAQVLRGWREVVSDAQARGLECWVVFSANVTTRSEIAEKPYKQRHFYPFRIDVRLDDKEAAEAYFAHRADIVRALDNADAYVTIDGDPGTYPGAKPETFLEVFKRDRATLDGVGRQDAHLVPWMWSGWGSDWHGNGPWQQPLDVLTRPVLELLKREMPEPFTLLPGRSSPENMGNGRTNFALAEEAGLIEKSVLLTYEIIEYEPTPPTANLQFDDIRRVLGQERPLIERARGVMGNSQQPIMALPNLFFYARAARDANYLQRTDDEVLTDLAEFLGGPAEVLVPAWKSGRLNLQELSGLPEKLASTRLESQAAHCLPGGAARYVEILSEWVKARIGVLEACAETAASSEDATRKISDAVNATVAWWKVHRYVFTGEYGNDFRVEYSHPLLMTPLREWIAALPEGLANEKAVADELERGGELSREEAENAAGALVGQQVTRFSF